MHNYILEWYILKGINIIHEIIFTIEIDCEFT